ncbi:hypothetical protein NIES3974_08600 [Calothrix sp. NIES-3974]|nr:hypothetical protein NIES3974_08600 [Calothrix sp. NIES-3974]
MLKLALLTIHYYQYQICISHYFLQVLGICCKSGKGGLNLKIKEIISFLIIANKYCIFNF